MKLIKIILMISIFMLTFSQLNINTEAATITRPSLDLIKFFNDDTFKSNIFLVKYKGNKAMVVKSNLCYLGTRGACYESAKFYGEVIDALNNKISFNNYVVSKLKTGVTKFSLNPVYKNIQRMNQLIRDVGYESDRTEKRDNIGFWWLENARRLGSTFEVKRLPPIYVPESPLK